MRKPQKPQRPQRPKNVEEDSQKLQKVIAASGRGSRRQIENWIADGRVSVNGEVAHLDMSIIPPQVLSIFNLLKNGIIAIPSVSTCCKVGKLPLWA